MHHLPHEEQVTQVAGRSRKARSENGPSAQTVAKEWLRYTMLSLHLLLLLAQHQGKLLRAIKELPV